MPVQSCPGASLASGCSKRSYVESMMYRLKSITGASLASRTVDRQKVELRLRCKALNANRQNATKYFIAPNLLDADA